MKTFFTTTLLLLFITAAGVHAQCSYFTKIVTGSSSVHTLGIKSDSTLWAWGSNQFGQLGDGTDINQLSPEQIGLSAKWVAIATGNTFSLAIDAQGNLWSWGDNEGGQLGDGTTSPHSLPKKLVTADSNWVAIAACGVRSYGITADGKLWAWGNGITGNNGGSGNPVLEPMQVGVDTDWKTVSAGNIHTIALKKNGILWAWGRNAEGETGDGTGDGNNVYSPEQIGTDTTWESISAGSDHSLAIKKDSSLWAWGQNIEGEIGDSTTTNATHGPVNVGIGTKWVAIAGGATHSLAIDNTGHLWAWGENTIGEFGNGNTTGSLVPGRIGTVNTWLNVQAGLQYSTALTTNALGWAWGRNDEGELGIGNYITQAVPNNIGEGPVFEGLADNGNAWTLSQGPITVYATDCQHLIATITQSGIIAISGATTATVWIDPSVKTDTTGKPYVQRHYQIATANPGSTGTVTLYFKQAEFTAYNNNAAVLNSFFPKLPVNADDADNFKANLRITEIEGVSSDGTGRPSSYSGPATLITPTSVVFANGSWVVTFNVNSFCGFFVTTGTFALPVTWISVTATADAKNHAQVNWKVQEQNIASYAVERSGDGRSFINAGTTPSLGNGINSYQFTDAPTLSGTTYYRVKQTGLDGNYSYSNVIKLDAPVLNAIELYPNPVVDYLTIRGINITETYSAVIIDMSGRTVAAKSFSGSQNQMAVSSLAKGTYVIKITTKTTTTTYKFVKN